MGTRGGPSAADLSWVLNAYAVVYAALLVPFGRLADRYGRKQLFVAGLVGVRRSPARLCALAGVGLGPSSASGPCRPPGQPP